MAQAKPPEVRRLKMAERAEKQRELYFGEIPMDQLWSRKLNDGYGTIPRILPIVMEGIDALEKNHAAGHVYFCLWCRAPDHPLLIIDNPMTFAAEAGYRGDRATDTWRRRMRVLRDAGFIAAKQGPSGEFHYVLLLNPTKVMVRLRAKGEVQEGVYNKLVDRSLEVGSFREIEEAMKAIVPPPPSADMPMPPRPPMPKPSAPNAMPKPSVPPPPNAMPKPSVPPPPNAMPKPSAPPPPNAMPKPSAPPPPNVMPKPSVPLQRRKTEKGG